MHAISGPSLPSSNPTATCPSAPCYNPYTSPSVCEIPFFEMVYNPAQWGGALGLAGSVLNLVLAMRPGFGYAGPLALPCEPVDFIIFVAEPSLVAGFGFLAGAAAGTVHATVVKTGCYISSFFE